MKTFDSTAARWRINAEDKAEQRASARRAARAEKAASLPYTVSECRWADGSCSYKVVDRADWTPVSRFYPTRIGAQRECNRRNREGRI